MPKLTKEELMEIRNNAMSYLQEPAGSLSNEFGQILDNLKELDDDRKVARSEYICQLVGIYANMVRTNNYYLFDKELTEDKLHELGLPQSQLTSVLKNINKIDSIDFIDEDGKTSNDIVKEDKPITLDNLIKTSNKIEVIDKNINEVALNQAKQELNREYKNKLDSTKSQFSKENYGNGKISCDILWDEKFFNDFILDKMQGENSLDKYKDQEYEAEEPLYKDAKSTREDMNERAISNTDSLAARTIASNRLSNYISLKNRIDNKKFLDVLKSPIKSLMEWIQYRNAKSDLTSNYKLSDAALNQIEQICSDKKLPENFGILNKDGTTLKKSPTNEDIVARYNSIIKKEQINDIEKDTNDIKSIDITEKQLSITKSDPNKTKEF